MAHAEADVGGVRHAIISVGDRVNSKRGARSSASGYTLNERRLAERGMSELEGAVAQLARTLTAHAFVSDEGAALLGVLQRYTRAWRLLWEGCEGE